MLQALRHRGAKARIATTDRDGWAIGYSSNDRLESHLVESAKGVLALDGTLFQRQNCAKFVQRRIASGPFREGVANVMSEPGEYAVIGRFRNQIIAFRDLNGLKPLYYAGRGRFLAYASERKALWKIGLVDVKRVLPGYLYSTSKRGMMQIQLQQFKRPLQKPVTFERARSHLARLLERSTLRVTKGIDEVAVAFSGGLDSAVAAALAKRSSEVELISVGLSGSPELLTVQKYACEMDLPITVESFDPDSLEGYVRRVVWLIEEPNLMKVSVAVPLHWAAMLTTRRGFRVMLCGQGSDELYGGYYKYAKILDTKGRKALASTLYRSVIEASQVNYERDEQTTAPFDVELRTPFADLDVIRFSLAIPSEYKVKAGNDVTRKWILRSVAEGLGLPEDIVWRRKKAIQHGTGVENAIRKLAKSRNLTAESYLAKVHAEVRNLESMP
jgi:asparagine synthase (glutamine-hydrolysing)